MKEIFQLTNFEKKIKRAYEENFFNAVEAGFQSVWTRVAPFTMLSRERVYALYCSVKYAAKNKIPGDVVEIGAWKGGLLASALALITTNASLRDLKGMGEFGRETKTVYGFDTFDGHPRPRKGELDVWGKDQYLLYEELSVNQLGDGSRSRWGFADFSEVEEMLKREVWGMCDVQLVKGLCEETIPIAAPKSISVLRLDVDWYEPTIFSLRALYPRVSSGGILIVDDFGHHGGARAAVTEYFDEIGYSPMLSHTDYSCVSLIKI